MRINIDKFLFSLFFYGIIFLPGLLMILNENLGSNYYGVIVVSAFVIFFKMVFCSNDLFLPKKGLSIIALILLALTFHLFIAVSLFPLEKEESIFKILFSLFSIAIILIACFFTTVSMNKLTDNAFLKITNNIFFILLGVGVLSSVMVVLGLQNNKKMFFFTEPSHYALVASTFYAYKISIKKKNVIYGLMLLAIALSVQNLSLIIGVALAIIINFLRLRTLLLIPVIIVPIYTIAINMISDERLEYYSQRLDISENSNNTSTLTLLSGYEQAYLALKDTYGFGYGLQRMGYPNDRGLFVDTIGMLRGGNKESNLHDGGLFVSKLTVEFGIFGLVFFLYVMMLGIKGTKKLNVKLNFFSITLIMSSMYFLLRGSGYFTPSAILIFWSIVALKRYK